MPQTWKYVSVKPKDKAAFIADNPEARLVSWPCDGISTFVFGFYVPTKH